jgi:hypothetical protein
MSRKVPPVEIPDKNPFEHDVLDREPIAKHLTSLLRTIEDPFVFSLSSPYGTGKSTFVRMWQQHLENEGLVTLYYDAWSNDFVDDPLVAFIDEITTRIEGRGELADEKWQKRIAKIKTFANTVAWRTIPVGLKLLTAGLLDANNFDEQVLTEAVQGVSGEAIEQYRSMRDEVQEFRETLTELVKEVQTEGSENPIVLFVDELDRCRPDHAVLLLERIKHFFSIPGITFVLSMEPDQLQHSVKALYGSGFDAKGYLRRFIDLDFPLPEPERETYARLLFNHHDIRVDNNNVLNPAQRDQLIQISALIAKEFEFGLREQKQHALRLAVTFRIVIDEWQMNFESLVFLSFLIALRMHDEASFQSIMEGDIASTGKVEEFRRGLHPGIHRGATGTPVDFDEILQACLAYWKTANLDKSERPEHYERVHAEHTVDVRQRFNILTRTYNQPLDFQRMIQIVQITKGMGPFFGDD